MYMCGFFLTSAGWRVHVMLMVEDVVVTDEFRTRRPERRGFGAGEVVDWYGGEMGMVGEAIDIEGGLVKD